jgi:hypothetical protein
MSELRTEQRHDLPRPDPRRFRGLRSLLRDLRAAWQDPSVPTTTPMLRNYPIQRPIQRLYR